MKLATTILVAAALALMALPGASAAGPGPIAGSGAQAEAAKLDQLFRDLRAATSESEGLAIENQIVRIWLESGDPQIDEWMDWAIRAMDSGAYDLALTYLGNIIMAKPGFAEGWNKRATLYYAIGRYQESLADIAETLKLEPRHFGAIAGRGLVMLQLDQPQKALEAFREVLAIDPQLTNIRVQALLLEDLLKRNSI
jgi:tetratricopeptide (TPR) repeat protein